MASYENARLLFNLRSPEFIEYNLVIGLCGGNKADIER